MKEAAQIYEQMLQIFEEKTGFRMEDTADLATPFHSMGPVTVDGKAYEKIISKAPLDAPALEPTVEDGYICFIEKLS